MKVALECRLPTDRLRLGIGNYRAIINPVRNLMQPATVASAEVYLQKAGVGPRQFGNGSNTECRQLLIGLGADSVNFAL